MKLKNYFLLLLLLAFTLPVSAQEAGKEGPVATGTITSFYVPSLASRSYLPLADNTPREIEDGRYSRRAKQPNIVIGKGSEPEPVDPHYLTGKIPSRALLFDFEANASNSQPTDPAAAVGPDHYFTVFNTGYRIFDKTGTALTGPLNVTTIFSGGGCCDLTVSYDNDADRWVVGYLFFNGNVQVAVSDGPNPITAGWNVYTVPGVNDYNKLSVWSDGYYMTANNQGSNKVWVLERDEMLLGNTAQTVTFNLPGIVIPNPGISFFSPQVMNVSNNDFPAAGGATVIWLQDDSYGGVTTDHVKLWTIDMNWAGGSTISNPPVQINTQTSFTSVFDGGSFSNLPQPGGGSVLDALQAIVHNQAQFRRFGTHNSAVFNFTIDTDPGGGKLAGIRWFELRQPADNTPWTLFQEGTYNSPDGKHAWNGSMMMDSSGNIAMGYTGMGGPTTPGTERASTYYTGRFDGNPAGTMTVAETLIEAGTSSIPGGRYGDYSKMDIDPIDDTTFWFINEIAKGGRKNHTGVFKLAPDLVNDVGVISIDAPLDGALTNAEQVTVTIFNFGSASQSNIPVNLTIDGNSIADEVFAGPLAGSQTAQYTFTATGDFSTPGQTYVVESSTNLAGDELNGNDDTTKNITNTTLGTVENSITDSDLLIVNKGNQMYEISLPTTAVTERLNLTVTNMLGQKLLFYGLDHDGQGYSYNLDMSYASSGVYIISIGDGVSSVSGRIVVE